MIQIISYRNTIKRLTTTKFKLIYNAFQIET